jgi:hypothetical protein
LIVNLYTSIASRIASPEAAALSERLSAWHDAMVAHERRLASGRGFDACNDDCPHEDAEILWEDAVRVFGENAAECEFLRSRAGAAAPTESWTTEDGRGG